MYPAAKHSKSADTHAIALLILLALVDPTRELMCLGPRYAFFRLRSNRSHCCRCSPMAVSTPFPSNPSRNTNCVTRFLKSRMSGLSRSAFLHQRAISRFGRCTSISSSVACVSRAFHWASFLGKMQRAVVLLRISTAIVISPVKLILAVSPPNPMLPSAFFNEPKIAEWAPMAIHVWPNRSSTETGFLLRATGLRIPAWTDNSSSKR